MKRPSCHQGIIRQTMYHVMSSRQSHVIPGLWDMVRMYVTTGDIVELSRTRLSKSSHTRLLLIPG